MKKLLIFTRMAIVSSCVWADAACRASSPVEGTSGQLKAASEQSAEHREYAVAIRKAPGEAYRWIKILAIHTDEKGLFGESSRTGDNIIFELSRRQLDGSLDPTFGAGGLVSLQGEVRDLRVEEDQKLLVLLSRWNHGQQSYTLARYKADGTPDTSFNSSGTIDFSSTESVTPISLGLQTSGAAVVLAVTDKSMLFTRFTAEGQVDRAFGEAGTITADVPQSLMAGGTWPLGELRYQSASLASLNDGGLLASVEVRYQGVLPVSHSALFSVNVAPDGQRQVALTYYGRTRAFQDRTAAQGDGKALLFRRDNSDFALARFSLSNDTLVPDATFGTGGHITIDETGYTPEMAVATSPTAFTLLGVNVSGAMSARRYNISSGQIDATFGEAGVKTISGGCKAFSVGSVASGKTLYYIQMCQNGDSVLGAIGLE